MVKLPCFAEMYQYVKNYSITLFFFSVCGPHCCMESICKQINAVDLLEMLFCEVEKRSGVTFPIPWTVISQKPVCILF